MISLHYRFYFVEIILTHIIHQLIVASSVSSVSVVHSDCLITVMFEIYSCFLFIVSDTVVFVLKCVSGFRYFLSTVG